MERRELPRYPVIDIAATGQNLRRLRLEKGYSVKELQEYLGLAARRACTNGRREGAFRA